MQEYRECCGPAALSGLLADVTAAISPPVLPAQSPEQHGTKSSGSHAEAQPRHAASHGAAATPMLTDVNPAGLDRQQQQQRLQSQHRQQQAGPGSLPESHSRSASSSYLADDDHLAEVQRHIQQAADAVKPQPPSVQNKDQDLTAPQTTPQIGMTASMQQALPTSISSPGSLRRDDAQQPESQDEVECALKGLQVLLQQRLRESLPAQQNMMPLTIANLHQLSSSPGPSLLPGQVRESGKLSNCHRFMPFAREREQWNMGAHVQINAFGKGKGADEHCPRALSIPIINSSMIRFHVPSHHRTVTIMLQWQAPISWWSKLTRAEHHA